MTWLQHQMLRDAGVLPLACAVALTVPVAAGAAKKPNPHNFVPPKTHVQRAHTDPHNFVKPRSDAS